MSRKVVVLVSHEQEDLIDVCVADYDNREADYTLWLHEDGTATVRLSIDRQQVMFRRSKEAVKAILGGVIEHLDNLKPRVEPERIPV
jgi:hypothetical protein